MTRSPAQQAGLAALALALATLAATAATDTAPAEPPGCSFLGQRYAVGERWVTGPLGNPGKCAKYLCEGDDQVAAVTCPWFVAAPGCTVIPGDEAAAYPGCCPLRKCHHDEQAVEAVPPAPPAQPTEDSDAESKDNDAESRQDKDAAAEGWSTASPTTMTTASRAAGETTTTTSADDGADSTTMTDAFTPTMAAAAVL